MAEKYWKPKSANPEGMFPFDNRYPDVEILRFGSSGRGLESLCVTFYKGPSAGPHLVRRNLGFRGEMRIERVHVDVVHVCERTCICIRNCCLCVGVGEKC